jgi:hypothetical protein
MSTEERRRQNRERFPKISAYVDLLNAAGMGPVRVIWCEENGNRAGNRNG